MGVRAKGNRKSRHEGLHGMLAEYGVLVKNDGMKRMLYFQVVRLWSVVPLNLQVNYSDQNMRRMYFISI